MSPGSCSTQTYVSTFGGEGLRRRAGEFYGSIRAALAAEGDMIGNNDLWIAAPARTADLILVTNNEREFRRIQGLEIQNWADG